MVAVVLLLLPADPLRPRRVDEHFAPEAQAARDAGIDVALVDHDALTSVGSTSNALAGVPPSTDAVYRGWMLTSEQYARFEETAGQRGTAFRTSGSQYRAAHELPGWYDIFRPVTPEAAVARGFGRDDLVGCLAQLADGPAVLRDYVKSAKHYWSEAAFVPDVTDVDRAWTVAQRFLDLRGEDRTGGFVLRRYEPFGPSEVRTWWIDGRCALVTAHPDTPDQPPPVDVDVSSLPPLVAQLGAPFVTVDLAPLPDGRWRVVELGDGQVSDRPSTTPAAQLLQAISR